MKMRKHLYFFFVLFLAFSAAQAQYDTKALSILDAMSAKYKSIPAYRANISSSLINKTDGVNEAFKGEIMVKEGKYRLKMPEQEVINNGAVVWTYLPDVNEVNIDNYEPDEEEISLSNVYSIYKSGYKYIFVKEVVENGVNCEQVDLIPEDRDSQFFKISMNIGKKDRWLQSLTMFDKSGNQYKYIITDFTPTNSLGDSFFVFDKNKYPGVEIVDLR